jgi:uncharacterized protein (DUF1330 family)
MTATSGRPAYAVGYLRDVAPVPQVAEYIERIEATMAPFGGEWLVHGCSLVPLEGTWTGALVVIRFPSLEAARQWWDSPAYREIAPLRTDHSDSMVCLVEGVPQGYRAATTAAALRSQLAVAT